MPSIAKQDLKKGTIVTIKQTTGYGQLFKLKKWLTVKDSARHLSTILAEEVSEADVLRLALDGHLRLSINFVNGAKAKCGQFVEEMEWKEIQPEKAAKAGLPPRIRKYLDLGDELYLKLGKKVTTIKGVWDLTMFGGEKLAVENEYQQLTGGPPVKGICWEGAIVEGQDGQICQLQNSFIPVESETPQGDKKKTRVSYYPADVLPFDSVLVVRVSALLNLQERLSEESVERKPLKGRAETTYNNIIGALLEFIAGDSPGMEKHPDFKSEAKLIEHFCSYNIPGLSKTTLELKFAAAKRSLTSS